jgi:hypothetical protein
MPIRDGTRTSNELTPIASGSMILVQTLELARLDKEFKVFYGTRRFIAVLPVSHHWSLS